MKTSQKGIDLIKVFESFSAYPYKCPAGKMTIGYGHVILLNESIRKVDKKEAENILKKDVEIAEKGVNQYVNIELNQNQFDALVSFVFNIGIGNFYTSTLLHLLNKCDFDGAANQFLRWVYAEKRLLPGLEKRRAKEKELFESCDE
jgi:lysozyme